MCFFSTSVKYNLFPLVLLFQQVPDVLIVRSPPPHPPFDDHRDPTCKVIPNTSLFFPLASDPCSLISVVLLLMTKHFIHYLFDCDNPFYRLFTRFQICCYGCCMFHRAAHFCIEKIDTRQNCNFLFYCKIYDKGNMIITCTIMNMF